MHALWLYHYDQTEKFKYSLHTYIKCFTKRLGTITKDHRGVSIE